MKKITLRPAGLRWNPEPVLAALMLASYPVMLVASLTSRLSAFAAAALVSYVTDAELHRRKARVVRLLSQGRAGITMRFLIREILVVLLAGTYQPDKNWVLLVATVGVVVFQGLQMPHSGLLAYIRKRRVMPVATRNIDLTPLRIADAAPQLLTRRATEKILHLDLFAVAGIMVATRTGHALPAAVGVAVTLALAMLYALLLLPWARRSRLAPPTPQVLEALDAWLASYRPTTVLYFSGSRSSAYQVNMWLDTLAGLEGRPLVILRERHTLYNLAATSVPVLCVPSAVHLMNMDLSTVRVALYPANVGKNIHMLREPHIKHVFVGHGDSDKLASVNPFSKVYDEVWTAGRAGRDRYALADVGVRDEDIVEVGRPQLGGVHTAGPSAADGPRMTTVLYAPTWEGWTDDPGNTSLILAGENIVRRLLESDPAVRVLYKPHPFTGSRSPVARAAHERVTALVEQAAARRNADPRWARAAAEQAEEQRRARAEMAGIDARLAALQTVGRAGADETERSRDGILPVERLKEAEALTAEWHAAYWRSFGWWEHQVIAGPRPSLFECFNQADAMVSDISSVVSDFIASQKPYALTDTAGLGAEEFRLRNTAARAAVVLTPDAAGIDELLQAVRSGGEDPLAASRRELKEYLLGPDQPDSATRFGQAVRTLTARAETRLTLIRQRAAAPDGTGQATPAKAQDASSVS